MTLRASTLALIALAAGCVETAEDAPESAVQQDIGGGGCAEWACGTNSPYVGNFGFTDLLMPTVAGTPGPPNDIGMQVLYFGKKVTDALVAGYLPRVIQGKLYAYPFASNPPGYKLRLSGAALVDGYFLISSASTGPFKLWVKGVGQVRSWAQPPGWTSADPPIMLESYKLDWSNINGEVMTNVCDHAGNRDDLGVMNGPLSFHTLLYEGDRIDAKSKVVSAGELNRVTLGCAGSALAKLPLTGHAEAAKLAHTFDTTLDERTTMLKLLVADYCGDGTPFTVQGQPLNWADDHGTMKMAALAASPPRPLVRETRWTPTGPACLDAPRVDVHWTSLGEATFGSILSVRTQAAKHCPTKLTPACAGSDLGLAGYHLISATEPLAGPP